MIKTKKDLSEVDRKPIEVKWEPSAGKTYAILYRKMIEIYSVAQEAPLSDFIFNTAATSFDFIS